MEIGGLAHCFSDFVYVKVTSAVITYSESPGNFFILHIRACFSGSYFAFPEPVAYTQTFSVLGTGILTTTFVAKFV